MSGIYIPGNDKYIYVNAKRLCKEQGKQLGEVENQAGLSKGYLSRTKYKTISVKKLIEIANILEVTIDELLCEPPKQTNFQKFVEVFGFAPGYEILDDGREVYPSLNDEFWNAEYKNQTIIQADKGGDINGNT
jgi:transcriptional regulator with XRE-family HTH domain